MISTLSTFLGWSTIPWLLLTLAFVVLLYRHRGSVRDYLFTVYYTGIFSHAKFVRLDKYKAKLFDDLGNFKSRDSQLRNQGLIRILEIGSGPGINFQYYPENCRLVCYEPNPFFKKYVYENRKRYPGVDIERYVVADGEKLVGTPDNSVDIVVSTLVNCCVKDLNQVLNEIQRVLAPGGRYYFLDHEIAPERHGNPVHCLIHKIMNNFQKKSHCNLQCDMEKTLKKTGFTRVHLESFIPSVPIPFRYFVHDFYMGFATK